MSSLLATIREFLRPPDPRSEREIENDLDAEFAFHIERIERELIEQGVPREQVADLVRARFGNQTKLKRRCKRIALEDRIMLQRINTVLMIIVMLAVIGVSIQMYMTQRYNSLALQDITQQIAKMRIDTRQEAREWAGAEASAEGTTTSQPASGAGLVYLDGDVERPGTYTMPIGIDFTVRRLLAGAGVDDDEAEIEIVRQQHGIPRRIELGTLGELKARPERDMTLQPSDLISITQPRHQTAGRDATDELEADARILIEGDIERPGWYPIRLDEATYVHDLLRRAGVHERQWVLHRPGGEGGRYELADLYLNDHPPLAIIRPGDELKIANDVDSESRNSFARRHADRYLHPYDWLQVGENGRSSDDGWMLRFTVEQFAQGTPGERAMSGFLVNQSEEAEYVFTFTRSFTRGRQLQIGVRLDPEQPHVIRFDWEFNIDSISMKLNEEMMQRLSMHDRERLQEAISLESPLTFVRFKREG